MFFGFSIPRNRSRYIFSKPYKVPTVFPFINFSCQGSFFFGQSSKCLSADCLRCEHTYLQTWRTSHKANKFSRVSPCMSCQNCVMKLRKPIFTCHYPLCKPPQKAHMHATLGHFQMDHLRANSGQMNRDKMADMIAAGAHGISNSGL